VIKGQLCHFFLHGGAGWILSRKAAERLLKIWPSIPVDYSISDDHYAMKYFIKLGIIKEKMDSKRFFGSLSITNPVDHISTNWTGLKECPSPYIIKMSDIVFWHASFPDLRIMINGYELLRSIPDNVYGNLQHRVRFCYK
jgi:GR25 family glycosyltransferase involved in LPS biosynthesis